MKSTLYLHRITLCQDKVLCALAEFKYLTTGQLLELGIMNNRSNMNKLLLELRTASYPLVNSISFGVDPKLGRLESVHYLTNHGFRLLKQSYGEQMLIRYPKGTNQLFHKDYFHRLATVNFHIAISSWAKEQHFELKRFVTYFDKLSSGKNKGFRAESAIEIHAEQYLIADAVFLLQTKRRTELYCVEVYMDDDTSRIHSSLFGHLQALRNGQPSRQFGLDYGSRVLCIFDKPTYMKQAMIRLQEDPRFASSKAHFLFKTMEEVKAGELNEWELFDGERVGVV